VLVKRTNPRTGHTHTMDVDVTEEQLRLWKEGLVIQKAMPGLSPAEREFIMTGILPEQWQHMFDGGLYSASDPV
jgi:hypothetical protein